MGGYNYDPHTPLICIMKKFFFLFIILFTSCLCSCMPDEQRLDSYYEERTAIENKLTDSVISQSEHEKMLSSLEDIDRKIKELKRAFAVVISPDNLNIDGVSYKNDDIDQTGEWLYLNLIYPLYCYESDYAYIAVYEDENFTSQEKFYIISYHLLQNYSYMLKEKYSYLELSSESIERLSFLLFGESINKYQVAEYSSDTDTYAVPFPTTDSRLLIPICSSIKVKDITKTEISVNYAEQTRTRSIYSETFVFDRIGEKGFFLYSRTRNNQSSSLIETGASVVPEEDICFLEPILIIPDKIIGDSYAKGEFLYNNYCSVINNYLGAVVAYETLSVPSLLNMLILIQPNIDSLISEKTDNYQYFGIPGDYLREQTKYFFGDNYKLDTDDNDFYDRSKDLYIYKIKEISRVDYNKQFLAVTELDDGFIRVETALFEPMSYTSFVAKEIVIFADDGNSSYYVFSRHFNMYSASYLNSVVADIVPLYPDVYPNTSLSDIVKADWLINNYADLLDFEFDSVTSVSSEKLAIFAMERLFLTEEFMRIDSYANSFAFPRSLVEEEIRLFFGDTCFVPEHVSFYDIMTGYFYVNAWDRVEKKISGTVIRAGSSNDLYNIYVDIKKENVNERVEYIIRFKEIENGSFRFVSAYTVNY